MSKSSIKPKATIIWSEQTAKLKQKFTALTERDLYFEEGRLEEMLLRLNKKLERQNTNFMR